MTKELLEDYPHICGELRDLDRLVTDTVSGSLPEPPYTRHTVSVQGIPSSERRAKLERQKAEVEAFVEGLPTSELRRIASYRMQKLSWEQVAAKMGSAYSADSVRKKYEKIFI